MANTQCSLLSQAKQCYFRRAMSLKRISQNSDETFIALQAELKCTKIHQIHDTSVQVF
jgi:hypothetical protein